MTEEEEEEKRKMDMLKRYYRSRQATFLKTIAEKNKKREQDLEEMKKHEEKKKAKLKEDLGFVQVQSRFMEDVAKLSKEVSEQKVIEELPKRKLADQHPRGRSQAGLKSLTSTSSFKEAPQPAYSKDDSAMDIQRIY